MKLKLISSKIYETPKDYSFHLTACTYNFYWFYNGEKLLIPLDFASRVMAMIFRENSNMLRINIYAPNKIDNVDSYFELTVNSIGLYEDLTDFYDYWRRDPLLSPSFEFLRGFHLRMTSLWNALLIGICQQNASFRQGWSMLAYLYKLLGFHVEINDYGYTVFPPSPMDILNASDQVLRACKLGYRVNAIRNVAREFVEDKLSNEMVSRLGEGDLIRIRGVGKYTARLALILADRRYSLAPIDRWLERIICKIYNVSISEAESEWRRRWNGWCGLAAFLTTIILDAEPLRFALKRIDEGRLIPEVNVDKMSPLTLWRVKF